MEPSDEPYVTVSLCALAAPQQPLAQVRIARAPASAHPEPLDASPYSYLWTARHDGGELPAVAATGHYALALSALQEAKATMDLEFQRLLGKAPAAEEGGAGGAAAGAAAGAAGDAAGAAAGAAGDAAAGAAGAGASAAAAAGGEGERKDKKARMEEGGP